MELQVILSTFAVVLVSFLVLFTVVPPVPASLAAVEELYGVEEVWEDEIPFTSTITEEYADPCKAGRHGLFRKCVKSEMTISLACC